MLIGAGAASGAAASLSEQAFEWKFEGRETFDTGELVSATVIGGVLGPAGKIVGGWGRRALGKFFPGLLPKGIIGADPLIPLSVDATSEQALAAVARRGASGAQYSVAYEMRLASSSYPGVYRGAHFLEANKALSTTMVSDVAFANSMSRLGISIPRSPTGAILGKSPTGWVWHHDSGAGVMQLVPKSQHTIGSSFWSTLHPNGIGGYAIWGK